ncbi:MAG: universal stress protein [Alphaproteobacteria bacterium]
MKDILVHVDGSPRAAVRIDLALGLARSHGAHLTGLHVIAPPFVPMMTHAPIPPEIIEQQIRWCREQAAKAEHLFKARVEAAGGATEWRVVDGYAPDVVALNARYSDLTIVGQTDPDEPDAGASQDLPDKVALAAGGPVLVVPRVGQFPTVGERALVAWNASREAKRAVDDAMPILRQARQVTVIVVKPQRSTGRHGDIPGADIALYLARHGVRAEAAQVYGEDAAVGDLILSRAADLGADLIVMGAFGYPRLMEIVLGGVTRALLAHMTVPVLLAH